MDSKQLRTAKAVMNSGVPKGDLAPAVPATATPIANNTGEDVMVRINGGTMTAVPKIDGVGITGWTTGDWVPLRSLSTIELGYSSAPTWQWFAY
jgi:hypothetical protein